MARTTLCKRVLDELTVIVAGVKGMSRLSRAARSHIRQCRECHRKHEAALRAFADASNPILPELKRTDATLARMLAERIVRMLYLFASPHVPPPRIRVDLFLLHDVITTILASGSKNVLQALPYILPEVARNSAQYFATPREPRE